MDNITDLSEQSSSDIYIIVPTESETALPQSASASPSSENDKMREIVCGKMEFPEDVLKRLLSCEMDVESLYLMKEEDINELFPVSMMGTRIKFKERLTHWRQNEAETISQVSFGSWLKSCSESQTSIKDLKAILKATPRSRGVLHYYTEHKKLLDSHRKIIVDVIVNHFADQELTMTMKDISYFTEQIVSLFPNEDVRYYCNRQHGKNPVGKLYDKATNARRKVCKRPSDRCEANKSVCVLTGTLHKETMDSQDKKTWLFHNVEPWSEIIDKWKETTQFRHTDVFNKNLNIFSEWPLLKHSLGYCLIDIDFEEKYPENALNLLKGWPIYKRSIIQYMNANIKDSASKTLLGKIDKNINLDSTDCIITLLLHAVLKPSFISNKQTSGKKRLHWKPSISDAQNATVLHCQRMDDYQTMYDELKSKGTNRQLPFQPVILVIGQELTSLQDFYVLCNDILYKVPTFMKALDTLFKFVHVLNLEYPIAAKCVYSFLEYHFFKLSSSANSNIISFSQYLTASISN